MVKIRQWAGWCPRHRQALKRDVRGRLTEWSAGGTKFRGLGFRSSHEYRLRECVDPTVLTNSSRMSAGILFWSLIIVAIPFQALARFSSLSL